MNAVSPQSSSGRLVVVAGCGYPRHGPCQADLLGWASGGELGVAKGRGRRWRRLLALGAHEPVSGENLIAGEITDFSCCSASGCRLGNAASCVIAVLRGQRKVWPRSDAAELGASSSAVVTSSNGLPQPLKAFQTAVATLNATKTWKATPTPDATGRALEEAPWSGWKRRRVRPR